MTTKGTGDHQERAAHLRWVAVAELRYNLLISQREKIDWGWVAEIAENFNVEKFDTPKVSERDGRFYVIDGMHRTEAVKAIGWGDQKIQCWVYTDLTERDEAELFLGWNHRRLVNALDSYRIAITAGRDVETDIDRVVHAQGLVVSSERDGLRCVGTLRRIYVRSGPAVLGHALRLVRDSFGTSSLEAALIDGVALVVARYNDFDDNRAVEQLGHVSGGVNGVLARSEQLRLKTRSPRAHCVAAAVVEIYNRNKSRGKLPSWWQDESETTARPGPG